MKTILVPTDFSPNALIAIQYAISLAQLTGHRLNLFHSYVVMYAGYDGQKRTEKMLEQQAAAADSSMAQLLEALKGQYPDVEIFGDCFGGYAADKIVDKIVKGNYSMVVMGTKGVSNLAEKILGSTTYDVISRSPIPVLAVPQGLKSFKLDTVGLFSAYDEAEINTLLRLRHIIGNDKLVKVIHLHKSDEKDPKEEMGRWENRLKAEFSNDSLSFHTIQVAGLDSGTIAQIAVEEDLDLLVFTKPQRSFFAKIFGKSLTRDVAAHLNVPSLFIKV